MKIGDTVITEYGKRGMITEEYSGFHDIDFLTMEPGQWLAMQEKPFTQKQLHEKWFLVHCGIGSAWSCESRLTPIS